MVIFHSFLLNYQRVNPIPNDFPVPQRWWIPPNPCGWTHKKCWPFKACSSPKPEEASFVGEPGHRTVMLVDFSHEIWEKWEAVFFGHDLPIFLKRCFRSASPWHARFSLNAHFLRPLSLSLMPWDVRRKLPELFLPGVFMEFLRDFNGIYLVWRGFHQRFHLWMSFSGWLINRRFPYSTSIFSTETMLLIFVKPVICKGVLQAEEVDHVTSLSSQFAPASEALGAALASLPTPVIINGGSPKCGSPKMLWEIPLKLMILAVPPLKPPVYLEHVATRRHTVGELVGKWQLHQSQASFDWGLRKREWIHARHRWRQTSWRQLRQMNLRQTRNEMEAAGIDIQEMPNKTCEVWENLFWLRGGALKKPWVRWSLFRPILCWSSFRPGTFCRAECEADRPLKITWEVMVSISGQIQRLIELPGPNMLHGSDMDLHVGQKHLILEGISSWRSYIYYIFLIYLFTWDFTKSVLKSVVKSKERIKYSIIVFVVRIVPILSYDQGNPLGRERKEWLRCYLPSSCGWSSSGWLKYKSHLKWINQCTSVGHQNK